MANLAQLSVLMCRWGGGVLNLKSPNTGKTYLYDPVKDNGFLTGIDPKDSAWLLSLTYGTGQDAATKEHYFYL